MFRFFKTCRVLWYLFTLTGPERMNIRTLVRYTCRRFDKRRLIFRLIINDEQNDDGRKILLEYYNARDSYVQ